MMLYALAALGAITFVAIAIGLVFVACLAVKTHREELLQYKVAQAYADAQRPYAAMNEKLRGEIDRMRPVLNALRMSRNETIPAIIMEHEGRAYQALDLYDQQKREAATP
jgi:hypothetical protein